MQELYRMIPGVDFFMGIPGMQKLAGRYGRGPVLEELRRELEKLRREAAALTGRKEILTGEGKRVFPGCGNSLKKRFGQCRTGWRRASGKENRAGCGG